LALGEPLIDVGSFEQLNNRKTDRTIHVAKTTGFIEDSFPKEVNNKNATFSRPGKCLFAW
jgi:hypothetical protein